MPLNSAEMKNRFKNTIYNGLKRVFAADVAKGKGYSAIADAQWMKMADAISDIGMDIVNEIQTKAQVVPGQQVVTAGSPSAQTGVTVSSGKIL